MSLPVGFFHKKTLRFCPKVSNVFVKLQGFDSALKLYAYQLDRVNPTATAASSPTTTSSRDKVDVINFLFTHNKIFPVY
jgi:hypothetical protein